MLRDSDGRGVNVYYPGSAIPRGFLARCKMNTERLESVTAFALKIFKLYLQYCRANYSSRDRRGAEKCQHQFPH